MNNHLIYQAHRVHVDDLLREAAEERLRRSAPRRMPSERSRSVVGRMLRRAGT